MNEPLVTTIARIAHEANRAYCITLGDLTHEPWHMAPEWQRASAIEGVKKHLQSDLTPEESHASWMAAKEADGWVWGAMKDPEAKTHPCMVPYSMLPHEQRVKDYLFRNIVHAFKSAVYDYTKEIAE